MEQNSELQAPPSLPSPSLEVYVKEEKPSRRRPPRPTRSRRSRSPRAEQEVEREAQVSALEAEVEPAEEEAPALEEMSPEEAAKELQHTQRPFAEWSLISDDLKRGIAEQGFEKPTPVQTAAFEPAMDCRDLVVQAKTGTGKTAAFGIPLLQRLQPEAAPPRAIILTPTRELAAQVATELQELSRYKGLQILSVYGGTSIGEQIDSLERGVDIVVGTPGRVLDHIRRKTLLTEHIETVVLDEADEMLSMGFYLEVSTIIERCNQRKQLMLFSATVPPDIEGLVRQYTTKPIRLMVSGDDRRVKGIQHVGYFLQEDLPRPRNLLYILEHEAPETAIIFCNRRDDTSMLAAFLLRHGKTAEAIHGEMNQHEREAVLQKLKEGKLQFMVATDVASRGIDISGLSHVFNYHFPHTLELYIHRVGRTGRQGRHGTAISMLSGEDLSKLVQLKRIHQIYFEINHLPPTQDVVKLAASRHIGKMFEESLQYLIEPYLPLADALMDDQRGRFVMAHLLKMYHEGALQPLQPALRQAEATLDDGTPEPEIVEDEANKEIGEPESQEDVRLYISVGTAEGYQSDSLRQMIANEANVGFQQLGAIQMERHHSFLQTDLPTSEKILAAFQERQVGEFTVNAEVARKQRRRRRRT